MRIAMQPRLFHFSGISFCNPLNTRNTRKTLAFFVCFVGRIFFMANLKTSLRYFVHVAASHAHNVSLGPVENR
jgi:hypothetical protein